MAGNWLDRKWVLTTAGPGSQVAADPSASVPKPTER